jgi:hypothetical protein
MPYIKQEDRKRFDATLKAFNDEIAVTGVSKGDLNYVISCLAKIYTDEHGHSYSVMNDVVGVLSAANMEYYRRVVVPYEDEKIKINGDCY